MTPAKPAETGLKFYPASHRYKLDGKWVRGVTTLIKSGLPNDALKYWSARTVAEYVADNRDLIGRMYSMGRMPMVAALKEIPWQRRDDAGVRGTEVHALAEKLIHGEEVAVPDHIAGHVDACVAFLDEWKPKALVVERPLASREHWYAGTPDMFAELPDGRKILFDWKTAESGIWPETAYQLTAYRYAEFWQGEDGSENPIPGVDLCAAVHITADGYDVIPVKSDPEVFAEFLHIAQVASAAKRAKGNKTEQGYVLQPLPRPGQEDAA